MIPRYRPVAYGGMAETEDGRYIHVGDLARALDMEPEQLDRLLVRGAGGPAATTGTDDLPTTEELEEEWQARIAAADRMAEAIEASFKAWGSWFGDGSGSSESVQDASEEVVAALAAYRESEAGES